MGWTRETGVIPGALAGPLMGIWERQKQNRSRPNLSCHSDDHWDIGNDDALTGGKAQFGG